MSNQHHQISAHLDAPSIQALANDLRAIAANLEEGLMVPGKTIKGVHGVSACSITYDKRNV